MSNSSSSPIAMFPKRTIHLDFHTGPDVPGVGSKFDRNQFADTFAAAHVDSVTVFAKCHHGLLYYSTNRAERHPGLATDLNLLEEQVDALHSVGIRAPIYLSVQCDEYAANTHPDWIALTENLQQVKWGESAFTAGWQILDMSSPYQDFLAEQIDEVVARFAPLDGLFLDMCWDQLSSSKWAKAGARAAGLDPALADDRATYARQVARQYMGRYQKQVEPHLSPEVASGVWFNSRPKTALVEEAQFTRHFEVESLPTGGWGYSYFPYVARFVRPLGRPTLSHTGRFHKSWGDNGGLKSPAALLYETTQILAQGMTSGVGDLLNPSGEVNATTYKLIGDAYAHIKASEPFTDGAKVTVEAAVVMDPKLGDAPGTSGIGAMKVLQQLRKQFEIVPPTADISGYDLIVVPETTPVDDAFAQKLRERAEAGKGLFISLSAESDPRMLELVGEFGATVSGPAEYSHVFLRPTDALGGSDGFDHVSYDRGVAMTPGAGADVLVQIVDPFFERSWDRYSGHEYTASSGVVSEFAALIQLGSVIVSAVPIITAVSAHAEPIYRTIIGASIDRLLPNPLLRAGGPVHLETTVMTTETTTVVHLISFLSTRAADRLNDRRPNLGLDLVYDPFPIIEVPIEVRAINAPRSVRLEPAGIDVPFSYEHGYVTAKVTVPGGHAMLVLDFA